MTREQLRDRVGEALECALENGYDMLQLSDREVAEDLWMHDADLEIVDLILLQQAVSDVRAHRGEESSS